MNSQPHTTSTRTRGRVKPTCINKTLAHTNGLSQETGLAAPDAMSLLVPHRGCPVSTRTGQGHRVYWSPFSVAGSPRSSSYRFLLWGLRGRLKTEQA